MNNNDQQPALYSDLILEASRNPYHFERRPGAGITVNAYNAYCGDKYQLYLDTEGDRVTAIHFHGYGCAVSKASCSVLARELEGKTLEEIRQLAAAFVSAIHYSDQPTAVPPAWVDPFLAARDFPGRETCVLLGWEALLGQMERGGL